MLTKAGAKLMDFGLAKPKIAIGSQAISPFTPSTPTMNLATLTSASSPLTQKGSIVGTFQYMAPEVLQGIEADARSDIFSLGCVLYEVLTGRRAFDGKSQLSVFTAILEKDPDPITSTQPLTPQMLDLVIRGCLSKDPNERFQSAHDVALNLNSIASLRSVPAEKEPASGLPSRRAWWLASLAVAIVLGVLTGLLLHRTSAAGASVRAALNPPAGSHFRLTSDAAGPPVLSPDGSDVAFTATGPDGKTNLWVRPMNAAEARALPDTNDAIFPFWSPDGRSIGFFADGKLKKVEVSSGRSPQVLCDAPNGRGGSWNRDGVIVFSPHVDGGVYRVSSAGGFPTAVTKPDPSVSSHRWPSFLPDGRHFLYLAANFGGEFEKNAIFVGSLDSKETRLVVGASSNAAYADPGYLLYVRDNALVAQRLDLVLTR